MRLAPALILLLVGCGPDEPAASGPDDAPPSSTGDEGRDEFWTLIGSSVRGTRRDVRRLEKAIDGKLAALEPDKIRGFSKQFNAVLREVTTVKVLEAACVIGTGMSNDAFVDFKRWIIFQGKETCYRILDNPDFLGRYSPDSDPGDHWYSEYDPSYKFEKILDAPLSCDDVPIYPKDCGNFDKKVILARRYPRLWARCKVNVQK